MSDDPILIRQMNPAVEGEESFILATWLRELRDADPSGLPDQLWFDAHRAHIKTVLADPKSVVLVAAAADDPAQILGYVAAYPGSHLEWVHVKKRYRGEGLAGRLLRAAKVPSPTPSRFSTPSARTKIRHLWRSRDLRRPDPR